MWMRVDTERGTCAFGVTHLGNVFESQTLLGGIRTLPSAAHAIVSRRSRLRASAQVATNLQTSRDLCAGPREREAAVAAKAGVRQSPYALQSREASPHRPDLLVAPMPACSSEARRCR